MSTITILIVEDQMVIASDLEARLVRNTYAVCGIAATGEEALDLARRHHPDLVLMDIRLEGVMDGIQAAEIVRSELGIPVIFLSAYSDNQTLRRAAQATPYAFLLKPYDDRELQLNIEVAVHKHAGERQLALAHQEIRRLNVGLEERVVERTAELGAALAKLKQEGVERLRMMEDLQTSEMRFRQLADNIQQAFFLADTPVPRRFYVSYVSPAYEKIWGRSCESLYAKPQSWIDAVHPEDLDALATHAEARVTTGRFDNVFRILRPDADVRWIRMQGFPIVDQAGAIVRIAGIAEDITEKMDQQQRVARLGRISVVLSAINSAIVRIRDRDALFQEVCRLAVDEGAFSMAFVGALDPRTQEGTVTAWRGGEAGYAEQLRLTARAGTAASQHPACVALRELKPVVCNDIRTDATLAPHQEDLLAHGHRSMAAFPLVLNDHAEGVIVFLGSAVGQFDRDEMKLLGEVAGDLSFGMDFIAKREQLNYLAYFDLLTGLPNKTLFHERLSQCLDGSKDAAKVAVILLDPAHFSHVNDVYGRHAGDLLLRDAGIRLQASLGDRNRLALHSGDTFAVFIPDLQQVADVVSVLERQILAAFEAPFSADGKEVHLALRAGLAVSPGDGVNADALLKHAEFALKQAKSLNERYLFYSPQMNASNAVRMLLEGELRAALSAQEFLLYYQPRIDLINGRIVSAEALIRWKHPKRGLVPPIQFIPLAEETGLILPIGKWVIDTVCAQQAAWLRDGVKIVPVAVNLSTIQFRKGQVVQTVRDAIKAHGLEKDYIEFELTESILMDEPNEAANSLQALKEVGGQLSLDDFGTGYSSLAYLKRFPFDIVKIDRAFVTDMTRSREDAAIATAVITMAHSLNMRVVAEGVETEAQLRHLRKLRCDELQGYLFSPPVPAAEFEAMLRADKRLHLQKEPIGRADTLLLVDDEPNILSSLKRMLRQDGYHILTADSGPEALELLALNTVQVIVTDQRMPGMSGTEFLSIAKEMYPDAIRLILTGYADLATVADSVNRGQIFKFIAKPWEDDELRNRIRDAFRRYQPPLVSAADDRPARTKPPGKIESL